MAVHQQRLRGAAQPQPRPARALLAGLGIGQLPRAVATELVDDGQLQPVLAPWQPPAVEVFAVYPSNRYLTPKVRAFVDLALEMFPRPISG